MTSPASQFSSYPGTPAHIGTHVHMGAPVYPGAPTQTNFVTQPVQARFQSYNTTAALITGCIQAVCGVTAVATGVVTLALRSTAANTGTGIWTGLFFLVSGIIGVLSSRSSSNSRVCLVISYMIISILCVFPAFFAIVFALVAQAVEAASVSNNLGDAIADTSSSSYDRLPSPVQEQCYCPILYWILLSAAVIQFFTAISASIICCVGACCGGPTIQQVIYVNQQETDPNMAPPAVSIPTEAPPSYMELHPQGRLPLPKPPTQNQESQPPANYSTEIYATADDVPPTSSTPGGGEYLAPYSGSCVTVPGDNETASVPPTTLLPPAGGGEYVAVAGGDYLSPDAASQGGTRHNPPPTSSAQGIGDYLAPDGGNYLTPSGANHVLTEGGEYLIPNS